MTENRLVLDQGWRVREASPREQAEFAAGRLPSEVADEGWMTARAPGCVHLDLMMAERLENPFIGLNERKAHWVENHSFIYQNSFALPVSWVAGAMDSNQRLELVLEGLETFADVYLNGHRLGESANQFLPFRARVGGFVREGNNQLLVYFAPFLSRALDLERQRGQLRAAHERLRPHARRAQFLTGWDNAPRLSGAGIWGGAEVVRACGVRVDDIHTAVSLRTTTEAHVSIRAETEVFAPQAVQVRWEIERLDKGGDAAGGEMVWRSERTMKFAKAGRFRLAESADLHRPALWWPSGMSNGDRTIYLARVTVLDGDTPLAVRETPFGIRRVELVSRDEANGGDFHLVINGHPVFVRGVVWTPPDVFRPRVADAELERLVDLAANGQFNLVRVWGGGIYESDAFYRRCDELGLMVWQDFMFTQAEYPEDKEFWKSVQAEATHQIKRLRNHPSLVLWCGNDGKEWMHARSEGDWHGKKGGGIFSKLLPKLVADLDPGRPYRRSTPFGGSNPNTTAEGDHHQWKVWDDNKTPDSLRAINARFISTFAFGSLPGEDCLADIDPTRKLSLKSPQVLAHQGDPDGADKVLHQVFARLRRPKSLSELVYMSQWVHADAVALAIEGWRAARPATMGAVLWHLTDCWPALSCSLVDFHRNPKQAYWSARRGFSPLALLLLPGERGLRAVVAHDGTDRRLAGQPAVLQLRGMLLDGASLAGREAEVHIPGNDISEVGTVTLRQLGIPSPAQAVVVGELILQRTIVASRLWSPVDPKDVEYPEPDLSCQLDCLIQNKRAVLVFRARNVVRGVEFKFEGIPGVRVRDENAFDIWPGREVWAQVDLGVPVPKERLLSSLRYRCLNDLSGDRHIEWRELPMDEGEGRSMQSVSQVGLPGLSVRMRSSDVIPKVNFTEFSPPSFDQERRG